MTNKRRLARVRPTGSIFKAGKIIVEQNGSVFDCKVIDFSAGGACLEVDADAAIPGNFVLFHGAARKKCKRVWRRGRRIGVLF